MPSQKQQPSGIAVPATATTTAADLETLNASLRLFAGSCRAVMDTTEDGSTAAAIIPADWGDGLTAAFWVSREARDFAVMDMRRARWTEEDHTLRFPDMLAVIRHLAAQLGIRPGARWAADS